MKAVEKFCGQLNGYSRSITLRNRLVPVGKTEENINHFRLLENDKKRADSYQEVKNIIDDYHCSFIQDVLSNANFEWGPLYDEFDLYQSKNDRKSVNQNLKIF